jgi:hypothetical protein
MADRGQFLPETETAVPIIRPPGAGKVVGVLGGQMTFKVLSEQTGALTPSSSSRSPPAAGRRCTSTATRRRSSTSWKDSSR